MHASSNEQIRLLAGQFVAFVEQQSGTPLGFELNSLGVLDALLSESADLASIYADQDEGRLEHLVAPIACYVGQVLARSAGARWDQMSGQEDMPPILLLPTGQRIDLRDSVRTVLAGRARPAFRQLAESLSASSERDSRAP